MQRSRTEGGKDIWLMGGSELFHSFLQSGSEDTEGEPACGSPLVYAVKHDWRNQAITLTPGRGLPLPQ